MKQFSDAFKQIFSSLPYVVITVTVTLLVLAIYYAVLVSATPWSIFLESNKPIYVFLQIILSLGNAILIGVVLSMFFYVLEKRRGDSNLTFLQAFASLLFSIAATGCTVCGAILLPTLGIAASLTALPLAGLEIKILTILLLLYSVYEYSKIIVGKCDVNLEKVLSVKKTEDGSGTVFEFNNQVILYLKPIAVTLVFFAILLVLADLPSSWRVNFAKGQTFQISKEQKVNAQSSGEDFTDQINPSEGYALGVSYGDIGVKTVGSGALDYDQFEQLYEEAGQPLTDLQIEMLTQGSDEEIVIDRENSYFLLNFFWAFGLANQNTILTEGDIAGYGDGQIGSFASTGGWSLASKNLDEYYSATKIVELNDEQQALVEEVSSNIYRPCCGNPTSFPDCNHGMALLGVLELMAANGASEDDMYEAAKYINAFWFPSTYNDLAMYYKTTKSQDYSEIDAKELLSKDFSSSGGYQSKKSWMQQEGILPEPPQTSGGGCGV